MNEAHEYDDDPGFRDFLGAYEAPEMDAERAARFADDTCLRILLQRHDPAAGVEASADFADRVVQQALRERSEAPREHNAPRAPAPIEMRSRMVPYLVAAAMLVATAVALIWPKGSGPTMPKVHNVAVELDARLRSASDPVSQIGGLVPVSDFAELPAQAPALEIPRFAPPNLHDFEAADNFARAREARGEMTTNEGLAR